jgi:hypothetical protein
LDLQQQFPIKLSDLRRTLVFPPHLGYGCGCIWTDRYAFSFPRNARLQFIEELRPFNDTVFIREREEILASGQKSLVNEADAYRMATNWLTLMSVDVRRLEGRFPAIARQECLFSQTNRLQKDFLPLFSVKWGNWNGPEVGIEIDGRTKDLLELRIEDNAVSQRPSGLITDRDQLVAITDQEFLGYSEELRRQLVSRFAAIDYDSGTVKTNAVPRAASEVWADAYVLFVSGTATKTITGDTRPLKGERLPPGTTIATGSNSTVCLMINGRTGVRVQSDSVMGIPWMYRNSPKWNSDAETELDLQSGCILGHVEEASAKSSFKIRTPHGIAAIRGRKADFAVNVTHEAGGRNLVTFTSVKGDVVVSAIVNGDMQSKTLRHGKSWTPGSGDVDSTPPDVIIDYRTLIQALIQGIKDAMTPRRA